MAIDIQFKKKAPEPKADPSINADGSRFDPAVGFVLIEEIRDEDSKILRPDTVGMRTVMNTERWRILAKGSGWYPCNGIQVEFPFEVGDEVYLAPQVDGIRVSTNPMRVLIKQNSVVGRYLPPSEERVLDA